MESIKKYLAEFIGTFVLVFFACGTAAVVGCDTEGGYFMTALSFGLVIVAMAYSVGNVSGCHINPAVSIAMLINGSLTVKDFIGYVVSQFAGAIAGAAALMAFVGKDSGLGTNALFEGDVAKSIVIEIILTFVFVFAILGVTSQRISFFGLQEFILLKTEFLNQKVYTKCKEKVYHILLLIKRSV